MKIEQICTRSAFSGVSWGISAYGDDILEAVDARELRVWTEDLCEMAAEDRADLVLEVRAGILRILIEADREFIHVVLQCRSYIVRGDILEVVPP